MLKPGGALFMEHFEGQGEVLARFMTDQFSEIVGHDDLNGRGRYISARKK
jgi:methylase of polypeptide subunit release factors